MPPKKKPRSVPGGARKRRGGFPCPDCTFVARHAMGLGRHRSARHGVLSQRQRRTATAGAWITREQAAQQAGVHYNTIRQWEHAGLVRTAKRQGTRGTLINASDLRRLIAQRSGPVGGDSAAVAALERRFTHLIDGLERLIASVKEPRVTRSRTESKRARRPVGKATRPGAGPARRR